VKRNIAKKLRKSKRKINKRVKRVNWENQPKPMFAGGNTYYDIDGRHSATSYGGIGNIHELARRSGLVDEINRRIELLKRHLPYHESDHILNIAYNYLVGGSCLQDIELLRNDIAWLNALGAEIIPDPTTAGDFLRRFTEKDICEFMDVKNTVRSRIWKKQPKSFRREAVINVDGTIAPTCGECKQGMDISYNGQWGYHPLIISLHNTREPLFIVNRPANAPSHLGSAPWIDKSLDLVCPHFERVRLRGDTDFSLTEHFDKWDERCLFVFGMDARVNLKKIAARIPQWQPLERRAKAPIKTSPRRKPDNVKEEVVRKHKFRKIVTVAEDVAEVPYRPGKCKKTYRLVILRKTLDVIKGTRFLYDEYRYFFFITNDWQKSPTELIHFYRQRSDHENDIDQLKNGLNALAPASDTLLSNWALMAIASLAWDLKAWVGLLLPYRPIGLSIVRMEFKRFLNTFIRIPCLIIRTGRRLCYRIVGYNDKLQHVIKFNHMIKSFPGP